MEFARDSNSNYVESQTNYDQFGAIASTASASFDSSGALLGGQMNYANGPLNEVAFARTPDGDFYARQSFSDGTQADSIVSYDAVQSNLANVQANGFDASPDIDNSLTVHDNSVDNFHMVAASGLLQFQLRPTCKLFSAWRARPHACFRLPNSRPQHHFQHFRCFQHL
ncbi:unnamed protein product [Sphagnum balticum]